jgi:ubiquitin carboxyl-terminal hydrolase 4/11/15
VQLPSGEWPKAALSKKASAAAAAPPKRRRSLWKAFVDILLGPDPDEEDDPAEADPPSPPGTHRRGLCGLHNLGNTCFMNSALQCLSNTTPLCEYFASGAFKKDVNPKNPMGMKGQVAQQFGCLLEAMWSGSYTVVSPRQLKLTIGKWAPQFSGFSQHDSQELLAFLLDGLHEDLNEVSKKPFIEVPEGGSRPDAEVAEEAWAGHKRRNRSLVVETF